MGSEETKHVLERCGSVVNDNKSRPKKRQVNLLKHRQRQELEAEIEHHDKTIERAKFYGLGINVGEAHKRKRDIAEQLEDQSPYPSITPDTRDALNKRRLELEAQIKEGMLPTEVMRRNPFGAVGQNVKWQKRNTARVLEWQNIMRQLEPDSEDPDISNVEKLRPSILRPDGVSTYMGASQIPGVHAMSPLAKDNFPETMGGDVNSALAQVQAREALPYVKTKEGKKFKEKECKCGCRQMFLPKTGAQKFLNRKHKEDYFSRKGTEARESLEVGDGMDD